MKNIIIEYEPNVCIQILVLDLSMPNINKTTIYKMKKSLFAILLALTLSGCVTSSIDKINVSKMEEGNTVAVLNAKVFYKNNKKTEFDMCTMSFLDKEGKQVAVDTRGDYAFLYTKSDQLTLDKLECISLRVIYNQARRHEMNEKITFFLDKGKINYLGDVKIEWTPEMLDASDLFPFGMFGALLITQDRGSFKSSIEDGYENYRGFMKKKYPALMDLNKNSIPRNWVNKSID